MYSCVHYDNICLWSILRFFTIVQNGNFHMKKCNTVLIFAQNIDHLTEAVLTSTHNLCLRAK